MRRLRWMLYRLATFARGGQRQRDLDAELQFHLDAEAADRRTAGEADATARAEARRALGNLAIVREDARAVWTWGGLDRIVQDLRYAGRVLARERSFAATALLSIALLVGGSSAVFTLVESVLLRPLPYPDSDRIVSLQARDGDWTALGYDEVQRLRGATTSFDAWGLYRPGYVVMIDRASDHPLLVADMRINPGLFPMLGISVVLGRPLAEADELDSSPEVAVISYDLWQKRFGGTPDVLGKTIAWRNDRTLTVVGVTEAGANVPTNWLKTMPIVWNPVRASERSGRSMRFVMLAHVKAGRTVRAAAREVALAGRAATGNRAVTATPLLSHMVGDTERVLWLFFAAVLAVLFIGVANLASLQLVRNAGRAHELGVRGALGAARWRLVRQLGTESLVLGTVGGAAGFLAARWLVASIVTTLPADFPRADQIAVDAPVWLFAVGVSLIVSLAIGILPALRVLRPGLAQRVNESAPAATVSHRRARLQRGLIAFEIAAALMLLVGAGLLVHSFGRLISQSAGMQERNLWAVRGALPPRYQPPGDRQYWTDALRLIRELPGVERATVMMNDTGPLSGGDIRMGGLKPVDGSFSGEGFSLSVRNVGADYFETLGIPLIAGRPILESDLAGVQRVAVLNQLAASTMWPGAEALGRQFGDRGRPMTVIGIVPDFKLTGLDGDVSMQMYVPYTQSAIPAGTSAILVRDRSEAPGVGDQLKAVLRNLEKDLGSVDASTMSQVRWKLVAAERFRTAVLTVFALTATFLSLVGVFGVVAYTVAQRTREIGLRVALGATRSRVTALMVRQALVPAGIGSLAGIGGALAGSRLLKALLFEIEPTDPATFGAVIGLFLVAAIAASLLPALRILRIDPASVLRRE
jgi:putative ABC transport system permease protein